MPSNGSYCCVINCSNNALKGFRLFRFRYLNSFIIFRLFKFCKSVKVKVKVEKNLEKTVQNGGSLNLAMISLPYREKLLLSLASNK